MEQLSDDLHRELRRTLIRGATVVPPSPWRHVSTVDVKGLLAVGFSDSSERVLVLAQQQRSVFDCASGRSLAMDTDYTVSEGELCSLVSAGFGPLENERIRMAGCSGGGLATSTRDGWSLRVAVLPWPRSILFLLEPGGTLFQSEGRHKIATDEYYLNEQARVQRSFGFSYSGNTLIHATSLDITFFSR